jgi:hypothetical protein
MDTFKDFFNFTENPLASIEEVLREYKDGETDLLTEGTTFIHRTTKNFVSLWNASRIPPAIKARAQDVFNKMVQDPQSVDLKKMNVEHRVWRVKIQDKWRALAVREGNTFIWFWIGPREELNKLHAYRSSSLMNVPNPQKPMGNPQKPLRVM